MPRLENTHDDYRSVLLEELSRRTGENPRYSLRAFARHLAVRPERLSEILNGNRGLSAAAARELSARLGLTEKEAERFCALVEMKHARSQAQREAARVRLALFEAKAVTQATSPLEGLWRLTMRYCSSRRIPARWNPNTDSQDFEFRGDRFSFSIRRHGDMRTRIEGEFELKDGWLHTRTNRRLLENCKPEFSNPWLAPEHKIEWQGDEKILLDTPACYLRNDICAPGDSLITQWARYRELAGDQ